MSFTILISRLATTQCSLPATVKAKVGSFGVTAISPLNFGANPSSLIPLVFWPWNLMMVRYSNRVRFVFLTSSWYVYQFKFLTGFHYAMPNRTFSTLGNYYYIQPHLWQTLLWTPWNYEHKRQQAIFMSTQVQGKVSFWS